MAIGIPVLLFYFQQRAERVKQRSILQVEAYSSLSIALHELIENDDLNRDEFERKRRQVLHEYTPKMLLYTNDDSLLHLLDKINHNLEAYSSYENFIDQSDMVLNETHNKVSALWNALQKKDFKPSEDLLSVKFLKMGQTVLRNEISRYRSTVLSDLSSNTTVKLFDSLTALHEDIAQAIYDVDMVTDEVRRLELESTRSNLNAGKGQLWKLLPECDRILQQALIFSRMLHSYRTSSRHYISVFKNPLKRLDQTFIESNRYLSE